MARFLLMRIGQAVPTLLGVTVIGFVLIHLVPGDPGRVALGLRATPGAVKAFDAQLGLNAPLPAQFVRFAVHALRFDFGQSFSEHMTVTSTIGSHITPSALLIVYGTLLALAVTVPVSLVTAMHEGAPLDHAVRAIGMLVFTMPVFWVALLLSIAFGLEIRLFPTSGYGGGISGVFSTLTLPAVTLALFITPLFIRTLRGSLIDGREAGYVEAARARGFTERRVLYGHALRNAALPLVTLVGLQLGILVSATVVIENVFDIPGLGSLLVTAVEARDFALVQGLVVLLGFCVVAINLLTDLMCALLDPRIRL